MPTISEILRDGRIPTPPGAVQRRVMNLAFIQERPIAWVWEPYIPAAMVTNIVGDPEAGKGWVSCAIAASVTGGPALPGQTASRPPPGRVLFLAAEDNPEFVLVARLRKQGADLARVGAYTAVFPLTSPSGCDRLRTLIRECRPKAVFIDPITSFLGDGDPNKTTVVNELYSRLALMALEEDTAIIVVRHRRKPADGERRSRDPKFGGVGSVGFLGGARSELLVGMTADGQRAMAQVKLSVGRPGPTLAFSLHPVDGTLSWEGEAQGISDWDLTGKMPERRPGRPRGGVRTGQAAAFLTSLLRHGPVRVADAIREAEERGITKATLCLARRGVARAERREEGWWWVREEVGRDQEGA